MDEQELRVEVEPYKEDGTKTTTYRADGTKSKEVYFHSNQNEREEKITYYAEDGVSVVSIVDDLKNAEYDWHKVSRYDKTGQNLIYSFKDETQEPKYYDEENEGVERYKVLEQNFRDLKTNEDITEKEFWKRLLEREPEKDYSEIYVEELGMTVAEFFGEINPDSEWGLDLEFFDELDYKRYITEYKDKTSEIIKKYSDGTSQTDKYFKNNHLSTTKYDKDGNEISSNVYISEEKIVLWNGEEERRFTKKSPYNERKWD